MNNIERRIATLEKDGGTGRLIIVSRPRDMTDTQLEAYLASHGISARTADLQVSLQRLAEGATRPWVSINGEFLPQ